MRFWDLPGTLGTVRRQSLSDRKGVDLREYLAHLGSFKQACVDSGAVAAR